MFELLLLTSIALIVFSQELPTEKSKRRTLLPEVKPLNKKKVTTNPLVQVKPQQKKQPNRNHFERAA